MQSNRSSPATIGLVVLVLTMTSLPTSPTVAQTHGPQRAQMHDGRDDMWRPGWMQRRMWGERHMRGQLSPRMRRHWTYMHLGIPEEYRNARSDIPPTTIVLREGRELYRTHCTSCHGRSGMGDGEAGKALSPSPALLAYLIQRPMAVDEYLMWTISEGGKRFGTDMPAFKGSLSRANIWKIIGYMRWGFPQDDDPTAPR